MRHRRRNNGFSLIEMLAATVILGVLITVVLAPLTQLFKNSGKNGRTLQTTTQTQQVVEYIRGQWQSYPVALDSSGADQNLSLRSASQGRYDSTCGTLPAVNGLAFRITVKALDRNAGETSTIIDNATALQACTSAANTALMKRVTVTTTTAAGERSSLTLDIPRP